MPRLLFVDLGSVWGGQEIYSLLLAKQLVKKGWTITFLSPHAKHNIPGCNFIKCSIKYLDFFKNAYLVYRYSKHNDIVHFNGNRAIYLSSIISRDMPFIGTKHSQYQESFKGKISKVLGKFIFRNLDQLICVSNDVMRQLSTAVKNATVITNGVEDIGGSNVGIDSEGTLTICYVGRLVETKGLLRLLRAADILNRKQVPFKLLIAGEGPLEDEMISFITNKGLNQCIRLLGYVEDPSETFKLSHLCVLPSTYEGLPLSLLEAMACKCALLGHDVKGVRDIIRHQFNGIFSDISPESLASSIEALNQDRNLLKRMRECARRDYEFNWRADKMVQETINIYSSALKSFYG